MPGKLIIPFHFHFDLMCQPHTPNLTAAFNTSQEEGGLGGGTSLSSKVTELDQESLLTVNLNKGPFLFITLLHFFLKACLRVPPLPPPGITEQQSSLSISHHVLLQHTAKTNTLINRIR